jgi:hypothetical protein
MRVFLHLRDHVDEVLDEEGSDYPNMDAVKAYVLAAARDVMAGDLELGVVDLRCRIDAQNTSGEVVYSLSFKHAVIVIPDHRSVL